jgi:hypothetical protein
LLFFFFGWISFLSSSELVSLWRWKLILADFGLGVGHGVGVRGGGDMALDQSLGWQQTLAPDTDSD